MKIVYGLLGLGFLWQIVLKIIQLFTEKKVSELDIKIKESENKISEAEKNADQLIKEYEDAKKNYDEGGSGNA